MNYKLPFVARFMKRKLEDNFAAGKYSEKNDLHMKIIDGKKVPIILTEDVLYETKTITKMKSERED